MRAVEQQGEISSQGPLPHLALPYLTPSRLAFSRLALGGLALVLAGAVVGPGRAAVMGGARVVPFDQAVERSRLAAEAVIHRRGKETCLRGKLTNALLGLSASCEAVGQRGGLCALADQAVVQTGWSMAFMDATAHQVLDLIPVKSTR